MWKCLRSWFAWRFSLTRLVMAVLFLAAVVGLNIDKIGPDVLGDVFGTGEGRCTSWYYCGWPFPFMQEEVITAEVPAFSVRSSRAMQAKRLPWTHITYRYVLGPWCLGFIERGICAAVDALVALVPLALLLSLQAAPMKEWLGNRFVRPVGLKRLGFATMFAVAFVALNARAIGPMRLDTTPACYWGWPLPCVRDDINEPDPREDTDGGREARWSAADAYQLPWTHQTYRALNWDARCSIYVSRTWYTPPVVWLFCGIIDAALFLVPLAIILFFLTPRRQAKGRVE